MNFTARQIADQINGTIVGDPDINILNVSRATGNVNDDGYLNAAEFQNAISTQNNEQTFRYYYAMKADNPYNYGIPRQIRLGVKLDF